MLGRFFNRGPRASLDCITFDEKRYRLRGHIGGCRAWSTPDGGGFGIYFFPKPPDLPLRVNSAAELHHFHSKRVPSGQIGIVEVELVHVDGVLSVWTIFKLPQKPHGITYLGSITIPFSEFSFVVKMQCEERGVTGVRETALLMKAQADGTITVGQKGEIIGNWNPDDKSYDSQFPDHPLSRLRRELKLLLPSLRINGQTKKEKQHFNVRG
jgi:hypothetical protein